MSDEAQSPDERRGRVGYLSRRIKRAVVPKSVRHAAHPVRTAKNAVTPKPIKKVKRAAWKVANPIEATEAAAKRGVGNAVLGKPGRKTSGKRKAGRSLGAASGAAFAGAATGSFVGAISAYEAYCVKCKAKVAFNGEVVTLKNGRQAAQGRCPVCGTRVMRILGRAAVPTTTLLTTTLPMPPPPIPAPPPPIGTATYQGQYEGYCVKCRSKRSFDGQEVTLKDGRGAAQGRCPVCGTKVMRIL